MTDLCIKLSLTLWTFLSPPDRAKDFLRSLNEDVLHVPHLFLKIQKKSINTKIQISMGAKLNGPPGTICFDTAAV